MQLMNRWEDVIFELEGAKTAIELVNAARAAKKSLRGAVLRDADLRGADLRGADLRGGMEGVPVIKDIHQEVFRAASRPNALDMASWHTCNTTHCRAGWVVTLAGAGGKALEWALGTAAAAAIIYMASDPKLARIPDFYARNEDALEDMNRLAELEIERRPE